MGGRKTAARSTKTAEQEHRRLGQEQEQKQVKIDINGGEHRAAGGAEWERETR